MYSGKKIRLLAALGFALTAKEALATSSIPSAVTPQTPEIMRNVAMIENNQFMYPYIPSFRTSADGRVALSLKVGGEMDFYLMVPEKFNTQNLPFSLTSTMPQSTPEILSSVKPYALQQSLFGPPNQQVSFGGKIYSVKQQQAGLCDGTTQFPTNPNTTTNPYPCGVGGTSDCYDLTVLSSPQFTDDTGQSWVYFYGTPITVTVSNPKTTSAAISNVTVKTPVVGPSPFPFKALLEPMATADGHLLVARTFCSVFKWNDSSQGGQAVTGSYNIVYSVAGQSAKPCDVTQWTNFYPIAHAYTDPMVNGIYGFADTQFRDSENNPIPENKDIEGTYPWIDRMGRNLFFFNVSSSLFFQNSSGGVSSRFPESCVPGISCSDPTNPANITAIEATDNTRGLTVLGRWTHQKEVLLDSLVNNIDYGLGVPGGTQRMVTLYQSPGAKPTPVAVQLGSGRSNTGSPGNAGNPEGSAVNTTFVESLENILTYNPVFKPITLRDVVWRLNLGKGNDEIAFDDYVNANSFIISEMTASTTYNNYSNTVPPKMTYNDGFVAPTGFLNSAGVSNPIHLQNAATALSSNWNIPKYGLVAQGSAARLEPAALGGIKGKGFWLSGKTNITYAVVGQPQPVSASPWFINLFVDPRFSNDTMTRPLVTFPDGSRLNLTGLNEITLSFNGASVYSVEVPGALALPSPGWSDLSLMVSPGGTQVGVYLNGYMLGSYTGSQALFQPTVGNLVVGGAAESGTPGFVGWIDDFKVIAQAPDLETICNHARGTLIGVNSSSSQQWQAIANAYLSSAENAQLNSLIQNKSFTEFACFENYASDTSAAYVGSGNVLGNLPSGTLSIRSQIHFPEGPLQWNVPRPNSTNNGFCLSCHTGQPSSLQSLSMFALSPQAGVPLQNDTRRQPLQLPRLMFGNVPELFINNLGPSKPIQAPQSGELIDQWNYPTQ
jgi:hypothetical protein